MYVRTSVIGMVAAAAVIVGMSSPDALAARHCVDFDDLVGGPYTAPFVSRGVNINVLPHHTAIGSPCVPPTSFTFARLAAYTQVPGGTPPNSMEVNNVRLEFTMADFHGGNPIKRVKLRYRDYGGNVNISVNGNCRSVLDFVNIPNGTLIGGVRYRRTMTRIILKKRKKGPAINAFEISGQELFIDNVCAWD